ncbi:MAG: LLM class flavin-dependent oxidoreductase [Betaproteobacteria bacterium]|nr:LLM class flavin-dependent oxidoreductase [Betaproteobacteria bacterium]
MKVGLYIATQFTEQTDVMAARAEMLEQVRVARQSGFASLWVPHHYATEPMQMLAPVPMLAWLLQEAEGMVIGANILIMPLLNPIHVAEDAVTLDLLSGGKYVLGVGIGYRAAEFDAFNVPLKERVPRMKEGIEIMRRLWTGRPGHAQGQVLHHRGHGSRPQARAQRRTADLDRRRGRRRGQARGGDWGRVADHQLRASEGTRAPDEAVPRNARGGRQALPGGRADHARVLRRTDQRPRARRVQGGASVQVRRLFVVGPGFSVGRSRVVPAAVRGLRQGPVHHRRQGLREGRDPALQRTAGRESLSDARAVAGIAAQECTEHHFRAGRDFRLKGVARFVQQLFSSVVTLRSNAPC